MPRDALFKLFNDASDPESNEINRFKAKFSQMVKDGKLSKAKMASPHNTDDTEGNAILDFIYVYVGELTSDQKDNVIETYGCGNAMALFCDWQRRCLNDKEVAHLIEEDLKQFIEDPVDMGLVHETVTIILQDSIGLWMEWRYM